MVCVDRFFQTLVASASCNKNELIGFWGQKVKGERRVLTVSLRCEVQLGMIQCGVVVACKTCFTQYRAYSDLEATARLYLWPLLCPIGC